MFHPFGPGTLQGVIDQIVAGLEQRQKPLRIAYLNPVYGKVLDACPAFKRSEHWAPASVPWRRAGRRFAVTFWTTR